MILAIDTSTDWLGIGLYDEVSRMVVAERIWRGNRDQCEQLVPAIDQELRSGQLTRKDVTAIAVATGPGTFNGVRVGVTTAKMLAMVLAVPLTGVGTFEMYAAGASIDNGLVRPVLMMSAKHDVVTALWRRARHSGREHDETFSFSTRRDDRILLEIESPSVRSIEEIVQIPDEPTLFVGEFNAEWRRRIDALGGNAWIAPAMECVRRPALLAAIAARRISMGLADNPATLAPVYARPPHITVPKR